MRLFTIGFTKTSAENFFQRLRRAEVIKVIDVRLNNNSQLAAFAKKDDLKYFLSSILKCDYEHHLDLAPTAKMLEGYKNQSGSWPHFEKKFLKLMQDREIEKLFSKKELKECCLLCSEAKPHFCHRRLVAEYLNQKWGGIEIQHL